MHILRSLLFLIVPGLLFFLALSLQLKGDIPANWQAVLALFPVLAVGCGLFLGWRFNRSEVFWAIVLLIIVARAMNTLSS